ncbi:MAG: CrcB family protein [Acidimicrobiia bacterium]|nr:CrcB family protein [Acidimicrobiia bacterium]
MGDVLGERRGSPRPGTADGAAAGAVPPTRYARPFLGIGFLGSFTTFSTFAVEADMLVRDGRAGTAAAYVLATVLVGSAAAWAGLALGRALPRRARGPTRPAEEELR